MPLQYTGPQGKETIRRISNLPTTIVLTVVVLWSTTARTLPAYSAPPETQEPQGLIAPCTPEAWALATTAVLTEHNHDRHDLLGNAERTADNIAKVHQRLKFWWGVTNREELLRALQQLELGGHRRSFAQMGAFLSSATPEQQALFTAAIAHSDQLTYRVAVVRKHYATLGKKSLLGWDYSRYIMLCRWGYLLGYLSEQEAWDKIWPAALLLQRTFASWSDLGINYLIGRAFWSVQETRKSGKAYYASYVHLFQEPTSPWRQCPWTLPLRTSTAEPPLPSE